MSLLSRFRDWIYLRFMRLKLKLELRVIKKSLQLRTICCLTLDAEIRYLKPDVLQLGEDDRLDLIVEYVARQLTRRAILPETESVAGEDLVFELIELAQKSKNVQTVIARYHAAESFFSSLVNDEVRRDSQLVLAKTIFPELVEYDARTVYQEYGRNVARHAKLRKQLAERSVLKLEFSAAGISSSIALVTAVFVVAGFLYIHYFYRQMGVEVWHYFSAADYLAASVEQIRSGAFAAAMSLLTFTLGIQSGSRRSKLQIEFTKPVRRRETWFFGAFTLLTFGICAYTIYIGEPNFVAIRTAGVFLSYWVATYISGEFFSNRLTAMTAIVGLMVFAVNVIVAAYERSEHLLKTNDDAVYLQKLHFKDSSPSVAGELYGANSSYYFIYDRNKKVTHIVPRDRVAQIDISRR